MKIAQSPHKRPRHLMSWASVQLVIQDVTSKPGGASWKEIKEAVQREGMEPTDWLTQVRGPLQQLINEGRVRRIDSDYEAERYVSSKKDD